MVKVDASKRTLRVEYTDEEGGYAVPCVRFDRVRWCMDGAKESASEPPPAATAEPSGGPDELVASPASTGGQGAGPEGMPST